MKIILVLDRQCRLGDLVHLPDGLLVQQLSALRVVGDHVDEDRPALAVFAWHLGSPLRVVATTEFVRTTARESEPPANGGMAEPAV